LAQFSGSRKGMDKTKDIPAFGSMKNSSSKPKVIRVRSGDHILFDGSISEACIEERRLYYPPDSPQEVANQQRLYLCEFIIEFGGKEYTRTDIKLHCNNDNRKILKIEKDKDERFEAGHVSFVIEPSEWKAEILNLIKQQEDEFYLFEHELLNASSDLLKGEYPWVHFKHHVEIDGCIVDGLAFVGKYNNYDSDTKIIGFEIKTNHDNYLRLYDQINSYLSICDEVYLVIEDKKIPKDLHFYVGIIRVQDSVTQIVRRAVSLKHSIDSGEHWKTLLKNFCTSIDLKRSTPLIEFFDVVENIKRKLIWNQFVIGWHTTYVKEYVTLTDDEKRLLRIFFADKMDEPLIKVLTLDHFFERADAERAERKP
jgi:hypothetical protein